MVNLPTKLTCSTASTRMRASPPPPACPAAIVPHNLFRRSHLLPHFTLLLLHVLVILHQFGGTCENISFHIVDGLLIYSSKSTTTTDAYHKFFRPSVVEGFKCASKSLLSSVCFPSPLETIVIAHKCFEYENT